MLIKCRECGQEISDKAEMCPHCGTPFVVKGEPVDETTQMNAAPNPGNTQQQQYQQPQQPYYPPQQNSSGNGLLYLIIGLLAAGLIGLGLYVFSDKRVIRRNRLEKRWLRWRRRQQQRRRRRSLLHRWRR